jgi:hypothetical protein
MSEKTEQFIPERWSSIWALHMDLGKLLPDGVKAPEIVDLISMARTGRLPARSTVTGGYLIRHADLPQIVDIVVKMGRRQR